MKKVYPNEQECIALLKQYGCLDHIILHSQKVKEIACQLNNNLISTFDQNKIICASLLHDIMRTHQHHDQCGAELLETLGYEDIAEIIREHHNITFHEFDERYLIYLADKLVIGNQVVTLEERFLTKYHSFKDNKAKEACLRRYQEARYVYELYERMSQK